MHRLFFRRSVPVSEIPEVRPSGARGIVIKADGGIADGGYPGYGHERGIRLRIHHHILAHLVRAQEEGNCCKRHRTCDRT